MRALRAYTRDDPTARAEVAAAAREAADVPFVGLVQAGLNYAENPAAATDLEVALHRSDRERRLLIVMDLEFADIEPARGRLAPATLRRSFDGATVRAWRLETEALLASDEVFAVPRERVVDLRREIAAQPRYPALNLSTVSTTADAGEAMRRYLLGLLSIRLDDTAATRRAHEALLGDRAGPSAPLSAAFATALAAEGLRRRGDAAGALALLDAFPLDWSYLIALGHFGLRERFVRAELLRALGRDAEAIEVYSSITNAYDLPFVAVSHLRRAQIQLRLGDRAAARFHYGRFLQWWGEADPERQPLVQEARHALEQLER
jgi:hypothetical protein